jgi:hypothetical protein
MYFYRRSNLTCFARADNGKKLNAKCLMILSASIEPLSAVNSLFSFVERRKHKAKGQNIFLPPIKHDECR